MGRCCDAQELRFQDAKRLHMGRVVLQAGRLANESRFQVLTRSYICNVVLQGDQIADS